MSSGIKFEGVYTALVTPFHADGSIDWESFTKLVESQIAGGVTGIVPVRKKFNSPINKKLDEKYLGGYIH